MPALKPDIIKKTGLSSFIYETMNKAIQEEITIPTTNIDPIVIKEQIDAYSNTLSKEEKEIYQYARYATNISHNRRDSNNYFHTFITFFIVSLKKTFPDRDFKKLENSLLELKKELENTIRNDNVDNDVFVPYLLGQIREIL